MKIKDYDYYNDLQAASNLLWCTNNNKILILYNERYWSVAHVFALFSDHSKWLIDNIKILKLQDSKGNRVIHDLAKYHPYWAIN